MIRRMELLYERRDKVVALNGPHGDPQFVHKATVLMHEHFRERLADVPGSAEDRDLYLAFAIAGHPQPHPILAGEAPGTLRRGGGRRAQPLLYGAVLPGWRERAGTPFPSECHHARQL